MRLRHDGLAGMSKRKEFYWDFTYTPVYRAFVIRTNKTSAALTKLLRLVYNLEKPVNMFDDPVTTSEKYYKKMEFRK